MGMGPGANHQNNANDVQNRQQQQLPSSSFGAINGYGGPGGQGGTDMASIASSFSFANKNVNADNSGFSNFSNASTAPTGSTFTDSSFSSSLSSQPTGATTTSAPSPILKSQITGFAPLKAFKPSSSFGASLLDSLPPLPGSTSSGSNSPTQSPGGLPPAPGLGTRTGFGASNSQPTGFGGMSTGVLGGSSGGLRPQMTGAANPFRMSMMATGGGPNFGGGLQAPFKSSTLPPFGSTVPPQNGTTPSFGSNFLGAGTGGGGGYDSSKQHLNGSASLI